MTAVGGTHVCLRQVDPGHVWELLDEEGVTHYNGAPTVQIALVNHPTPRALERPVTVCVAGGAAVADAARPHGRAEPARASTSTG